MGKTMSVDTSLSVRRAASVLACSVLLVAGCDFLDPTGVTNPNTTTEDLAAANAPTASLLPGLRAQMARTLSAVIRTTEMISDNFEIAFTNVTGELGDPWDVRPTGSFNDTGGIGAYWNTQELRAFADFVLNDIAPGDATATPDLLAEAHYYRGMAYLFQGENFIGVPTAADESPQPFGELLTRAEADFIAANGMTSDAALQVALQAMLARTYRAMGDAARAETAANAALALDPTFVHLIDYSASEIENFFFNDLRAFQPLPRLDFLDPKYVSQAAPIPVGKAEEMHLILAEIEMSRNNYLAASGHLQTAIEMSVMINDLGNPNTVRSMGTVDDPDGRGNPDLTIRPATSTIEVRADPTSPFRTGLVLDRPGTINVPTISGTSLTAADLAGATDEELRHSLWLARQEILFEEGQRLADLGVRLPVMQREIDANPSINSGDPATEVQVPAYIPRNMIDEFSPRSPYVDPTAGGPLATTQITIEVDMNLILAQQSVSKFGPLP
jgi:tetratricopeptide (TPR) repeat protein